MSNAVTTWSYSALEQYLQCPLKYKLAKIDKLPDPAGPALLKGRDWHSAIENYLKGPASMPIPKEGAKFDWLLPSLKATPGLLVEQKWAFSRQWKQAKWIRDDTTWLRGVVDAGVIYEDNSVELIDWKTGKQYESNQDQLELFALTAMVRYPEAPNVTTRLAYLESGEQPDMVVHKGSDREKLKAKWEKKVAPLFQEEVWAAKPNDKCGWCSFSRSKGGPCRYG